MHHPIVEEDSKFYKMHFMLCQKRTYISIAYILRHKTQKAKAQLGIKPAMGIKEMAGYVSEERGVEVT